MEREGYLEKLGGSFNTTWQKRYFEVYGKTLIWYKKKGDRVARGSLELKGTIVKFNPLKPMIVSIPTDKKNYQLKSSSKEEMDEWIDTFRKVGGVIEISSYNSPIPRKRTLLDSFKSFRKDDELQKQKSETKTNSNENIPLQSSEHAITEQTCSLPPSRKQSVVYDFHLRPIVDPFQPLVLPEVNLSFHLIDNYGDERYNRHHDEDDSSGSYTSGAETSSSSEILHPTLVEYNDDDIF